MKEEEQSPMYHIAHQKEKAGNFPALQNTVDQYYHPTPAENAIWQQMACNQLQQTHQTSTQTITKQHTLNTNAKTFVPQRLAPIYEETVSVESPSASINAISNSRSPLAQLNHYQPPPPVPPNAILFFPVPAYYINTIPNGSIATEVTQHAQVTAVTEPTCTVKKVFTRKFPNHANGNFYVGEDITQRMKDVCLEQFDDIKLIYYYTKQTIAMQINDHRLHITDGVCIINVDLRWKNGDAMYLIAEENDIGWRHKVPWRVTRIVRQTQIGVSRPASSRQTQSFQQALNTPPVNVCTDIIRDTNFKALPMKIDEKLPCTHISEYDLKRYCYQSWNNGILVPVVVIKGKKQWVEWKKVITIFDEYNRQQTIAISLINKGSGKRKKWSIGCIDCDLPSIFYKHKLTGSDHGYCYSKKELKGCITTSIRFRKFM
eukprot:96284_1